MGMLMNRFSMLTQLREDIKTAKDFGRDYNRFVLSGVVVHDINDHLLIEEMGRKFVKWAELTGDYFLFISFIQPTTEWKNSKYCHDGYWIDKDVLMLDSSFSKEDEERTLPLLRDFMGLPKSGSYLVLTENLSSNSFYRVPITAETIENQFHLITDYCNVEASGLTHTPKDLKKLLKELKADEYCHLSSLLDIMIDYTSVISDIVDNGEEEKIKQLERADKVIEKLRDRLKNYSGDDFEDKVFHLFECMEIVYKKLFMKNQRYLNPNLRNIETAPQKYREYLDNYSCKLLDTYNLLSVITSRNPENLDYSGLTIYLGKIVENELNLSIEQMLRHAMGIEMPKYFNKYCSRRRKVEIPAGRNSINVNQYRSNLDKNDFAPLMSIPMGNLIHAYKSMIEKPYMFNPKPKKERIQKLDEDTISFLKNFSSNYRNPAGHLDPNSETTYKGAKLAFKLFLEIYLLKLYEIKKSLK